MSKRKNRLLREVEAEYRLRRNPDFIAGALASGVPDALAQAGRNRDGQDAQRLGAKHEHAVRSEAKDAPIKDSDNA